MKLIFIRHTSVDVPPGVCYGRTDVDLTASFPLEAEVVCDRLREFKFDRTFVSPLSRCRRLAEFCGYSDATIEPRLLEMNFGEWEMKRFEEITDPKLQQWFDDYMNVRPTGGESSAEQRNRLISFLDELKKQSYETVGLFTHGGILMHALNILGNKSYDEIFRCIPPYGAIVELEI